MWTFVLYPMEPLAQGGAGVGVLCTWWTYSSYLRKFKRELFHDVIISTTFELPNILMSTSSMS